jgi:putative membrane protein
MKARPRHRKVWKGLAAGIAAGLVASWAMSQFHALATKFSSMPSLESGQDEDSTVKTAAAISEGVFRHALTKDEKKVAGPAVHYGFGAGVGGVYGALAEMAPLVTRGGGMPFGVAVWLGAHVITVPALGFSKPVTESPLPVEAGELAAHVVYGAVVEFLRRSIRRWMLRG